MPDPIFQDRRLAELYDPFDPDRSDLDSYLALADELDAASVLDVGCGTGTFACLLAAKGLQVVAVDPAQASLDVARRKLGAEQVSWLLGDATTLPSLSVDLATMTGNVAQVFLTDQDWSATLHGVREALRPGGHLVFETRNPSRKAWSEWNREQSFATHDVAGVGAVDRWTDLTEVTDQLVSFRMTFRFHVDGALVTSDSTLRFRERTEIENALMHAGLRVVEVRDAADRPGKEFVFLTQRVD